MGSKLLKAIESKIRSNAYIFSFFVCQLTNRGTYHSLRLPVSSLLQRGCTKESVCASSCRTDVLIVPQSPALRVWITSEGSARYSISHSGNRSTALIAKDILVVIELYMAVADPDFFFPRAASTPRYHLQT
jgi:hypothetical protein